MWEVGAAKGTEGRRRALIIFPSSFPIESQRNTDKKTEVRVIC